MPHKALKNSLRPYPIITFHLQLRQGEEETKGGSRANAALSAASDTGPAQERGANAALSAADSAATHDTGPAQAKAALSAASATLDTGPAQEHSGANCKAAPSAASRIVFTLVTTCLASGNCKTCWGKNDLWGKILEQAILREFQGVRKPQGASLIKRVSHGS